MFFFRRRWFGSFKKRAFWRKGYEEARNEKKRPRESPSEATATNDFLCALWDIGVFLQDTLLHTLSFLHYLVYAGAVTCCNSSSATLLLTSVSSLLIRFFFFLWNVVLCGQTFSKENRHPSPPNFVYFNNWYKEIPDTAAWPSEPWAHPCLLLSKTFRISSLIPKMLQNKGVCVIYAWNHPSSQGVPQQHTPNTLKCVFH